MSKNEITPINQSFLENVSEVLAQARKNAKTAVNLAMVYAYYEIGRMIVEEEQHGQNRAAYGKQILQELSKYLPEEESTWRLIQAAWSALVTTHVGHFPLARPLLCLMCLFSSKAAKNILRWMLWPMGPYSPA